MTPKSGKIRERDGMSRESDALSENANRKIKREKFASRKCIYSVQTELLWQQVTANSWDPLPPPQRQLPSRA